MRQVMSLLCLVGGIKQPQYTLLIILHLHTLLLNTKGASQYHTAKRCLQFFNISLASWVLPQCESDQCHSLWDRAHCEGGAECLLDLWGNMGEDRAQVWKVSLGLPRRVYWMARWLIRQTGLRQIKRDREGLSSEKVDKGIWVKHNMNHEGNITWEFPNPLSKQEWNE